jgi:hypothetical protein
MNSFALMLIFDGTFGRKVHICTVSTAKYKSGSMARCRSIFARWIGHVAWLRLPFFHVSHQAFFPDTKKSLKSHAKKEVHDLP